MGPPDTIPGMIVLRGPVKSQNQRNFALGGDMGRSTNGLSVHIRVGTLRYPLITAPFLLRSGPVLPHQHGDDEC